VNEGKGKEGEKIYLLFCSVDEKGKKD